MTARSLSHVQPPLDDGLASIAEIDNRTALTTRSFRAPNYEAEDRALAVLANELAVNPRNMLQKLVETALVLCEADTAGISLMETHEGAEVFRWEALAGVFAARRNGTMPRNASPCGICVDENTTQLMHLPDRCFPALRSDPRFVEALLIPFHHQGKAVGTVWIAMHQFDRKFDREDERIIRTLTAFASAGWQLWKASEAKDEFLALMGHELRNPLAAISSAMRAVQHPGIDAASRGNALSVVDGQVEDLKRMVDDLLDVTRLDHGKMELVRESIDLRSVIRHAVDTCGGLMDTRGHKFALSMPGRPIDIYADSVRLSQILTNILNNAAKYTPDGGQIWLNVTVHDNEARIAVRDTGVGIAAEELGNLFKAFQQSGRFRERSNQGLGLGLTLVERLVHLHGGTVTASSEGLGRGSEFVVQLPLCKATPAAGPQPEARVRRAITPLPILLVEDNAMLAYAFALELRLDGHDVRIAADGRSALAQIAGFRPAVILLDLGLPDMHGYDVARRVREQQAAEEQPVIVVLTGHVQEQDHRSSREAGCDYHLVKPVDIDVLRTILRSIGSRGKHLPEQNRASTPYPPRAHSG